MKKLSCIALVTFLLATHSSLQAQPASTADYKTETAPATDFPFVKGAREIEFGLSSYWSVGTVGNEKRPDMSFGLAHLSHGWMLTDASGPGPLRGNFELLIGVFGGPVWEGPGDGLAGANLLLRYNFVQPSATLVPFVQIGGGGVYSDAAKDDEVQRLIGSEWSWDLEGAIGVRWMLGERFAVSLKGEYKHFSNAGSSERNRGLNALGAGIAAHWFF